MALAPLFVPPLVLGMGLLPLLHFLGIWGTAWSLAGAHGLVALPVVYLIVRSGLRAVGRDLTLAARGLGAGSMETFRYVTWPLILPYVGTAMVFSFVLSFNEFILALFLTTAESETLPRVYLARVASQPAAVGRLGVGRQRRGDADAVWRGDGAMELVGETEAIAAGESKSVPLIGAEAICQIYAHR